GGGGGAVAGLVGGLGGDLAHHLRTHVLELVLELDLLGDGDAVLGDAGSAERLVEHDVAALGAERHAHGVGERIDAAQHAVARVDREFDFLGRHFGVLSAVDLHPEGRPTAATRKMRTRMYAGQAAFFLAMGASRTPMTSLSFMISSSTPPISTSVPDHLPNSTRSPTLRSMGMSLPASSRPPGPTAVISPCDGFSFAVSGMMMPPADFSSASMRLTTTRSCS